MKNLKNILANTSPMALAFIGSAGVVVTAISAAKQGRKLERKLAEESRSRVDISKDEIRKLTLKTYIPTAAFALSTIACIMSGTIVGRKQTASITAAYALLERSYAEYKDKVKDIFGLDGEKFVHDAIAKANEDPEAEPRSYANDTKACPEKQDISQEHLFYDEFSNTYFNSTMEKVLEAELTINKNLAKDSCARYEDWLDILGREITDDDRVLGWSYGAGAEFYGYSWIDFEHEFVKMDDGLECWSISMPFPPTPDFLQYD